MVGTVEMAIGGIRAMKTQWGRSILVDGLIDGEGYTLPVRVESSTLENLLRAIAVGHTIRLTAYDFQTREGTWSKYIDVVLDEQQPQR